ncbi:MAG: hypothetical protein HKM98_10840, partial [Gammaproteobacteria bacterium]|nr:hypothetical protein [Gammaproteobacteria bacterium]
MIVQCDNCHLRHDISSRPPGTRVSCRCGALLKLAPVGGDTSALTCPQCGGQADRKLARCQHCESALATVRCASCFGLAFRGNVHCPQCGGSLASPAVVVHDTGRQALPCPRCKSDMDATVVDKTLIDLCADCGGVWLDHSAFETLIREQEYSALTSALNIPGSATQATYQQIEKGQLYVPCPLCEQFMHRRNFAKRSGIILDVCAAHGIWFDANELSRVFNYKIVSDETDASSMRFKVNPENSGNETTVIVHRTGQASKSSGN